MLILLVTLQRFPENEAVFIQEIAKYIRPAVKEFTSQMKNLSFTHVLLMCVCVLLSYISLRLMEIRWDTSNMAKMAQKSYNVQKEQLRLLKLANGGDEDEDEDESESQQTFQRKQVSQ